MTADELAEHQASADAFGKAFLALDGAALGELYTDDAVLMPAMAPTFEGKEAIVSVFTQFEPLAGFESTIEEGIIMGDTAVVRGVATLTVNIDGEDVVSTAKFVEVRERQEDGSWLMSWDMFNYDSPPPDASASE